jgi:hypothetical protein
MLEETLESLENAAERQLFGDCGFCITGGEKREAAVPERSLVQFSNRCPCRE